MDIRKAVREIHARAEQESANFGRTAERRSPAVVHELSTLQKSRERLSQLRDLVGQMPPSPGTLRARVGARLVGIVRRMLFWYTPQIHRVQQELTGTIGSLSRLVELQANALDDLRTEVSTLRRAQEIGALAGNRSPAQTNGSVKSIPPGFEFALQDHFRGSTGTTRAKLEEWLHMICVSDVDAGAPWLDIGCGRGEWLALASAAGYRARGIDANPVAVDCCRTQGLCAEVAGAFEYLRAQPDESLGVVTMFHVVEHLHPGCLLEMLAIIFQKLSPGGLIAIETPNPANLLMASNDFWNDPTHVRPLPEALLTFMLEYAGFSIARRAGMNPFPPENHLNWTELDVVRQLDNLLYGARDYGVLGRR